MKTYLIVYKTITGDYYVYGKNKNRLIQNIPFILNLLDRDKITYMQIFEEIASKGLESIHSFRDLHYTNIGDIKHCELLMEIKTQI